MMNIDNNKIAVVTGANRGIGFETCRQLSKLGIFTILTSRDAEKGMRAVDELREQGLDLVFHQLDVKEEVSIERFKEFVIDTYGRCDILINNAGVFIDRGVSILKLPIQTLQETLQINSIGALKMCQEFLPLMQAAGYGRIVNVSSGMGSISSMGGSSAAYKLSKLMMNGMTRIMAAENKHADIKINTMAPGWVRSDMGGASAPRSLSQGADTIIWLATLSKDGPSGGFFEDRASVSW
jgi:NAD(P)-dependent dehydrogenase (short-subunit alcohol dehydrogenase family)